MLLWSDVASAALVAIGTIALVAFPIAGLMAVALELTRRRRGWVIAITIGALGITFGMALLLLDSDPQFRVVTLLVGAILMWVLARSGQRGPAGWLLAAMALPWAVYAGAVLVDAVRGAPGIAAGAMLPPFGLALAGIVAGILLIGARQPAAVRDPNALPPGAGSWIGPQAAPAARSWDAAGRAAVGPTVFGLSPAALVAAAGIGVGAQATAVGAHGRPIPETIAILVAGTTLSGLIATVLWAVAWPSRSRRAFEAFAWLGEEDLDRFQRLAGRRVAATVPNMLRYVRETAETPADRWIRVEAMVATGQLEAAREIAARLPESTLLERVEKATYLPWLDWLGGGPGDQLALRAAIEEIEPADGDDRLRGEVSVALAEVRQRVAAGDPDPAAPLRSVRDRIGRRANGVLFAVGRRRMLVAHLRLAAAFILVLTILDRTFAS